MELPQCLPWEALQLAALDDATLLLKFNILSVDLQSQTRISLMSAQCFRQLKRLSGKIVEPSYICSAMNVAVTHQILLKELQDAHKSEDPRHPQNLPQPHQYLHTQHQSLGCQDRPSCTLNSPDGLSAKQASAPSSRCP